ncbi:hypothetical protein [Pararobbsia silviterrae]|uniref:hypothetical protein n=1 Tax=Pararobbsia silviterrae TaxID=1792498 RepID=UPI0011C359B4|nr:hypothetical protein [Pararobbsia silviterrae]
MMSLREIEVGKAPLSNALRALRASGAYGGHQRAAIRRIALAKKKQRAGWPLPFFGCPDIAGPSGALY